MHLFWPFPGPAGPFLACLLACSLDSVGLDNSCCTAEVTTALQSNYTLINFLNVFLFGFTGSSLLCELSQVAASRDYSLVAVHGLLTAVASLLEEHRIQAYGIFPDLGWNLFSPALAGELLFSVPSGKS